MNDATWARVKEIFHEVSVSPTEERAAALERLCAGDARLRAEVEALLASHDEMQAVEPATRTEATETVDPAGGSTIGPYKLLQRIGEGGFGVVYMAEQEHPVRRRVALKIIKLGMDTKQVIARFEAERQALALMDHPNIAKVLDAGATEAGRPYFVMELVRGIRITEYCDRNKLDTRRRLELFMAVCGAVQHAHQKGVIHRDIKPSNVMVTLHDGTPVPKIIDFGIAKATNQRLTERTLFTEYNQFIGTPAYMSPEQAEMSGLDVDTRSDIYSLGVLLYELLVGTTPLDAGRLREAGYSEIQRIIRDEEPHRPSVRISTLGREATMAAEARRTDLPGLARLLRGDLDWVVMKALEKDRTRRYETANGLRLDIQRYLANEPVSASPPRAGYRMRKFVQRNRTGVTIAATVILALFGGLALAGVGMFQARREAAASRAINGFFSDMLASVDPFRLREHSAFAPERDATVQAVDRLTRDVSVVDMMLGARDKLGESFRGKPGLEATARETIGMSLLGLGRPRDAVEEFERVVALRRAELGTDHPDTIRSELQLGMALTESGRAPDAIPLLEAAWKDAARLYGDRDPRTLQAAAITGHALAQDRRHADVDRIMAETLERQREVLGTGHRDTLLTMRWWASSRHWRNQGAAGEELSRPAYEAARGTLGDDDVLTLQLQNLLGWSRNFQGDTDEGETLLRPAVDGLSRILGDDHPITCIAKMGLGRSLDESRSGDEKERLWSEALEGLRRSEGKASPSVFVISRDLAYLLVRRGKTEDGVRLFRRAVDEFAEAYGERHSWTLDNMRYLVQGLHLAGREREALQTAERLSEIRCGIAEAPDADRAALASCARSLRQIGRDDDAARVSRRMVEAVCRSAEDAGDDAGRLNECAWLLVTVHPPELRDPARALPVAERAVELAGAESKANILDTLALALHDTGRTADAGRTQRRALAALDAGPVRQRLAYTATLIVYLFADGADREAYDTLHDAVGMLVDSAGSVDELARGINALSNPLEAKGLFEAAELARREVLAVMRERWPGEDAELANLLTRTARPLSHRGRFADAEALLREAVSLARAAGVGDVVSRSELMLASVRLHRDDTREARAIARNVIERYGSTDGGQLEAEAHRLLAATHMASGDARAAEAELRAVVSWYRLSESDDRWRRARAEGEWGASLAALGRYAEAEPLVARSRDMLESAFESRSVYAREAIDRVERLRATWSASAPPSGSDQASSDR